MSWTEVTNFLFLFYLLSTGEAPWSSVSFLLGRASGSSSGLRNTSSASFSLSERTTNGIGLVWYTLVALSNSVFEHILISGQVEGPLGGGKFVNFSNTIHSLTEETFLFQMAVVPWR